MNKEACPNWYSVSDVCGAIGLSEKTLKEQCRKGIYTHKVEKVGTKINYYISRNSLPEYVLLKLENIQDEVTGEYSDAPDWARQQVEKYINIIKETVGLKGRELREYIEKWNIENPQYKTSYPCIIKMKSVKISY